jgi:hypothetical protein
LPVFGARIIERFGRSDLRVAPRSGRGPTRSLGAPYAPIAQTSAVFSDAFRWQQICADLQAPWDGFDGRIASRTRVRHLPLISRPDPELLGGRSDRVSVTLIAEAVWTCLRHRNLHQPYAVSSISCAPIDETNWSSCYGSEW